jgi:predicted MFS family arabinose efflux permease
VKQAPRRVVIAALGTTQIFAWGASYYLLTVLAAPIAAETGWPLTLIIGGLTLGLLAGGSVSPRIGRLIEAYGGSRVLSLSSVCFGTGLCLLGISGHVTVYMAGWILIGAGMASGLYGAAFATLGRAYGSDSRGAIAALTLWGGFASTVCWPLAAFLVSHFGWRGTCFIYAGIQFCLCLPLHYFLMPRAVSVPSATKTENGAAPKFTQDQKKAFYFFATLITFGGVIAAMVAVNLFTLLQARGMTFANAVAFGAMIGPAQVAARLVEITFGNRYKPIWTMAASTGLIALGLILLWIGPPLVAVAFILHASGNGIWSIARGTVPLSLFGAAGYATLMGRLEMPNLIAQAIGPVIGAILIDRFNPDAVMICVALLAIINVFITLMLWRSFAKVTSKPVSN